MTKNEIPALLPVQHDAAVELNWIEGSGEVEVSELGRMEWSAEAVEDDHGSVTFSGTAHSVEDFDAIIAEMLKLRAIAAQAREVCGH